MTNHDPFDGARFLDHLRSTSGAAASNDDTIGASNKVNHRANISSLSDIFEPPDEMLQQLDSTSSSDKSKSPPEQSSIPKTSSGGANGKPPIMPSLPPSSSGDSKPSSIPPRTPPPIPGMTKHHGRNVSWSLDNESQDDSFVSASNRAHEQREMETRNNASDSGRKLTISDVAPFEDEADTAILSTIDRQNEDRHHRSDTGTSTILSQVPDSAQHDFTVSPMPRGRGESYAFGEGDDDDGNNEPLSTGGRNRARTFSHGHTESKPLLHAASHQRGLSVEMKLLDLTESMMAMHGIGHHRKKSSNQANPTSVDRLTKSAVKMEQRESPERPPVPPSPRKSMRNLLGGGQSIQNSQSEDRSSVGDGTASLKSRRNLWGTVRDNMNEIASSQKTSEPSQVGLQSERSVKSTSDLDVDDMEKGEVIQESEHSNTSHSDSFDHPSSELHMRKKKKTMEDHLSSNYAMWSEFFRPRKGQVLAYMKSVILYAIIPLIGVAAILYYLAENPPTGEVEQGTTSDRASTSYILLFCVRQIITFSLAFGLQAFVIDFLALGTPVLLKLCGPVVTLIITQSKGWPHVLFWWSIMDLSLLAGQGRFAHHWVFYQDYVGLFNERNPSGQIVDNPMYLRVLTIAVVLSIVVAIKRFLVGLYLGRQTFAHYGQSLAEVMQKMLLVSQVANLARDVEYEPVEAYNYVKEKMNSVALDDETVSNSADQSDLEDESEKVVDMNKRHALTGSLEFSEKMKLVTLLEQWEEPTRRDHSSNEIATISAVLRFRKALTFMQKKYPFGNAFGPADNREACIGSAQEVYKRLLKASTDDIVQFELLALLALDQEGNIIQSKAKELIKLFRPDRQGRLTCLDFVKSVDAIYKEFRLLGATIDNSSQIDRAFENIFNVVFYIVTCTIILSQLGFDPLALFLSLSSVILAFAFMIGSASSKYFEGVLFILLRRPYGIGDRIQVGGIETDGGIHGALPWSVENVTLFETTLTFLPTNERASLSNGSLANSRIINWARSPQAQFHIFLQFPLNTPYHKLEKFKLAIEAYMKARPREWRALNGFRVNHVFAKENYIEHIIVIQHREPWQNVGQVLDSKANLTSYCQEVARELDMVYEAPRLPVDLKYSKADPASKSESTVTEDMDAEGLIRQFSSIARSKHAIRVC